MKVSAIKNRLNHRRRARVRARLRVTATRPRLTVTITNRHVIAQVVDVSGRTVVASSSMGQKLGPTLSLRAEWVGTDIAKKSRAKKIDRVVFDRNRYRYFGRIQKLAEAARAGGLEF